MRYIKNPHRLEAIRVLKLYSNIPMDMVNIIADYACELLFNDVRNVIRTLIERKTLIKVDTRYQS
jgi:hypothetical protein